VIPGCHFHNLVPLFVVFDFWSCTIIFKGKLNPSSNNTPNEDTFVVGEVICSEMKS
jgi:hypothetical protein